MHNKRHLPGRFGLTMGFPINVLNSGEKNNQMNHSPHLGQEVKAGAVTGAGTGTGSLCVPAK